jgi:hypothetical protein
VEKNQKKIKERLELISKLKAMRQRIINDVDYKRNKVRNLEVALKVAHKSTIKSIFKRDIKTIRKQIKRQLAHIKYIDKSIRQVLTS